MATVGSGSSISWLIALEEKIVDFLGSSNCSLSALCSKAIDIEVILLEVRRRFDSLDPNVPRTSKVRYLLIHAYEQLEAKPWLLGKWLDVLRSHGVPSYVLQGVKARDAGGTKGRYDHSSPKVATFSEEHISVLTEVLASHSGKWREMRLSLNLPYSVEASITARLHMYSDKKCLSEVLREWVMGGHRRTKAPTLENLKKALRSKTVGLGKTASLLDKALVKHGITPDLTCKKQDVSPCDMTPSNKEVQTEIVSQTLDTEVNEDKSTLLEVRAVGTCGDVISYQWEKDGCPLEDGEHYSGSKKCILFITGSIATCGTYTCKVRSTSSESDQLVFSNPAVVRLPHDMQVLVDMYRAQSEVHRDAWPPVGNRTYINLALVNQKDLDKGDAYSCYTIQGDVDDVVHKKESIRYDRAFGEHRSGAFLLIEGRPGSGKTTLVHKVSQDWAKGNILKGAKYVFLISLRVLSAKAIVKLADIMKELFYKNDDETAQNVLKKINYANGRDVCFILDGLDEYKEQDSVVFDLIRKTYLPRSMVIVSSRPGATFAYRWESDVYIEVIGFLKNEIREYILNYPFTGRGSPQSLLPYLDQHPNVLRMCYLPVHVAMVSFLHDKIKGDLPSTECKMYEHFTNLTLRRKEGSLPPNCEKYLIKICELAFQMTASHTQFFIDEKKTGTDDYPSLGLVTVDSTAGLYGYQHLYTFVHLTFQEYLAACHIAKLGEQEQREVISKYGHMKHMRVVWRFYCGLVSFEDEDPKFTCIIKSHDDLLFHCQCAFESQQPATCKSVVLHHHSSFEFKATHPADFTCLGYVISSCPLESLKVSDISTGDKTAKLHACADVLKQCGQLRIIDLSCNELGDEGAKVLGADLWQCNNLSELYLHGNEIGDKGAKDLSNGFRHCRNMSGLYLHENEIGDEGAKGLGDGLRQCSNLSVLWLDHNKIGDEGAKGLGDGLGQCNNLSVLQLNYNEIGDEGARGLSDGLRQCSNLSVLLLDHNSIGNVGAKVLGGGLRQCSNLFMLRLDYNEFGNAGAKGLGDVLTQCSNLSVFRLNHNEIGDEGAKSLGGSIRQFSNLSELYLDGNAIGEVGAKDLGDGLKLCINLSVLGLANNKIGGEGVKDLGDGLRQCSNLSELYLNRNEIGDEGAKGLGGCLKHCSNLSILHLGHNKIGDEGAKGICNALRQLSNLTQLWLSNNKIGDEGAKGLGDSLRQCSNLSILQLDVNRIGDEGAKSLGDGLRCCFNLSKLGLDFNVIGDEGAKSLRDSLKQCSNLSELSLDYNIVGDMGRQRALLIFSGKVPYYTDKVRL